MRGIDISVWQGDINFDEVVNEVDFAILRVGYGVQQRLDQKDARFDSYYDGLNGLIPLGAYYYAYGTDYEDGVQEAENCLAYMEDRSFELPIYYDMEESRNTADAGQGFVDRIRQEGLKAGIYASRSFYENKGLNNIDCDSVWIAMYGSNDGEIPPYTPSVDYNIWQYTSNGSVSGISGRVDMNITDDIYTIDKPIDERKSNNEIADEVINGQWGNGEERKQRLTEAGYNYNAIQDIVNNKLNPPKKSIEEVAQDVIHGVYGNGQERKDRLTAEGYDYDEVQDKVNEMLGLCRKSVDEIAREVIQGKWGNGQERKDSLTNAGYDYNEIQNRVNELYV